MDPFVQAMKELAASPLGSDALYRAKGSTVAVPCRIILDRQPDRTARPNIASYNLRATGHYDPERGLLAVQRLGTLEIDGTTYTVDGGAVPDAGFDWLVYLQEP